MIVAKAQKLEEMRVSKGWNKNDLARAAALAPSVVVHAEKGKNTSPKTAKAIADAFGVKVKDLFTITRKREA